MATSIEQIRVDPQQVRIFDWTKHLREPIDRIAPTAQPISTSLVQLDGVYAKPYRPLGRTKYLKKLTNPIALANELVKASLVGLSIDASETIQPYSGQLLRKCRTPPDRSDFSSRQSRGGKHDLDSTSLQAEV